MFQILIVKLKNSKKKLTKIYFQEGREIEYQITGTKGSCAGNGKLERQTAPTEFRTSS
jgi:hypothetical protein